MSRRQIFHSWLLILTFSALPVHAADSAALLNDRAALEAHLGVTDSGPRRLGRASR